MVWKRSVFMICGISSPAPRQCWIFQRNTPWKWAAGVHRMCIRTCIRKPSTASATRRTAWSTAISTRLFRITEDWRCFGIEGEVCPVGGRLFFFVMKSSSFWNCILTIKFDWKRRHIGTSAKKNHAYECPLYRVQILIILYSNAPYIAIANKNLSHLANKKVSQF